MKLVFIHGLPGVGKLTVALELAKLTGFKVFHNHLTVDLVTRIFEFGSKPFIEAREAIWFRIFAEAADNLPGLIFTFAPESTVKRTFIPDLKELAATSDIELVFVELTCDLKVLEERITHSSRDEFGKLTSLDEFGKLYQAGVFVTPGMPTNGLTLDTTNVSPPDAAKWIAVQLEEKALDAWTETSVCEAYSEWSSTYDRDRNRTRDLDEKVSRDLLGSLRFNLAVEIGCGTGKNTALLAQISSRVVAIDFSTGMIEKAKERISQQGVSNVSFHVADITQPWPIENASAELVACNLVLEHIENIETVFAEASRCLISKGTFLVSELHPFRQYQGTKAIFSRDQGTTRIQAFVHHISDFLNAARMSSFSLTRFDEFWHEEDEGKPPRLVTLMFEKA